MDSIATNILLKLNTARQYILLYPKGHKEIHKIALSALNLFNTLLEHKNIVTMAVFKDQLTVNNESTQSSTKAAKAAKEMGKIFTRLEIISVIFKKGVSQEEFELFLYFLAGTADQEKNSKKLLHIEIKYVNLDAFSLTEQTMIHKTGKSDPKKLINRLYPASTRGSHSREVSKTSNFSFDQPMELSQALNRQKADVTPVMNAYDKTLTRHFYSSEAPSQALGKKAMSKEDKLAELFDINIFLKKLTPALRKQFLSLTYTKCSENDNRTQTEQLLGGMDKNLIFEMLQQADQEKREISPNLFNVVEKVFHTVEHEPQKDFKTAVKSLDKKFDKMETLFDREKYEKFVEKDYDQLLKRMSKRSKEVLSEGFDLEFYATSLSPKNTEITISRMLLSLIKGSRTADETIVFLNVLAKITPRLLEYKEYSILFRCLGTFSYLSRKGTSNVVKENAKSALEMMENKNFIINILNKMEHEKGHVQKKIKRFLMTMSPDIVRWIILWCGNKTDLAKHVFIVDVLSCFKPHTQNEIEKHLDHSDLNFVYNMLYILKTLDRETALPVLKKLLLHHDQDISLAAFEALVVFRDKDSISKLSRLMVFDDQAISLKYIDLAGKIGVVEVNHNLISMVRLDFFSKGTHIKNMAILQALGNIGAPSSIPILKKIILLSWSLFPKRLLELKITAYKSIGKLPREASMDLLKLGMTSKVEEIKKICKDYIDNPRANLL